MTKRFFAFAGIAALLAGGMAMGNHLSTREFRDQIPAPAPTTLHCPFGNAEDSCAADYIGDGNWVLRKGNDQ